MHVVAIAKKTPKAPRLLRSSSFTHLEGKHVEANTHTHTHIRSVFFFLQMWKANTNTKNTHTKLPHLFLFHGQLPPVQIGHKYAVALGLGDKRGLVQNVVCHAPPLLDADDARVAFLSKHVAGNCCPRVLRPLGPVIAAVASVGLLGYGSENVLGAIIVTNN